MFQLFPDEQDEKPKIRDSGQTVHVGKKVHHQIKEYAKRHHMTMADVMRDAWDEFKRGGKS